METVMVSVTIYNNKQEPAYKCFHGDALTSPEQQAIEWMRKQEPDPLDNKESK